MAVKIRSTLSRSACAKEKWRRLTDDDLDVVNGRRDQLEGKIQERYGLAKEPTRYFLPPSIRLIHY